MLIPGQAQKEFFVNQSLAILDSLHPQAVIASQSSPPQDAVEGDCYRIAAPAVQAWAGCEDHLAVRISGDWHFVAPREGMRVFDRAADQFVVFRDSWQASVAAIPPSGGSIVDVEARAAVSQLIEALRVAGIFPTATV
jgi:hypothetical protein